METKAADDSHQMGYIQYWILDIHSLNGPLRPVRSTGYWSYIHIYITTILEMYFQYQSQSTSEISNLIKDISPNAKNQKTSW